MKLVLLRSGSESISDNYADIRWSGVKFHEFHGQLVHEQEISDGISFNEKLVLVLSTTSNVVYAYN